VFVVAHREYVQVQGVRKESFGVFLSPPNSFYVALPQNCEERLLSFMSGSPSAWNNLAATGLIFMKFYVQVFFENMSYKIHVSLKSDKNNEYFT
jgi:hypothetical protein